MMRVNIIEPIEISSLLDGINWIYKINIKLELISSNDKAARWGFRFHQSGRPGPGGTSERHTECPAGSPLCRSSWWSSRHWRRGRGRPGPWRQALTERKYQSNNLLKPDNCFEGLGWIVNSVQSSQWKEMKYHSLLWRICISFQLLTVHRGLNQGGDRWHKSRFLCSLCNCAHTIQISVLTPWVNKILMPSLLLHWIISFSSMKSEGFLTDVPCYHTVLTYYRQADLLASGRRAGHLTLVHSRVTEHTPWGSRINHEIILCNLLILNKYYQIHQPKWGLSIFCFQNFFNKIEYSKHADVKWA